MPDSAWADENLAERAGQLGKMAKHSNQSQPHPGTRADGTTCMKILNLGIDMTYQIEAGSVLLLGGDDAHDDAEDAAQHAGNAVQVQHAARVVQPGTGKIRICYRVSQDYLMKKWG